MKRNEEPLRDISLSFKCNERWDVMKPVEGGRHCDVCNKRVIDFTGKTRKEFEETMAATTGKVCGKFTIEQTVYKHKFSFDKAAALALMASGITLLACNTNPLGKPYTQTVGELPIIERPDTVAADTIKLPTVVTETVGELEVFPEGLIEFPEHFIEPGFEEDTIIPPDTLSKSSHWEDNVIMGKMAYDMPTFPGGDDALLKFIHANIIWPPKLDTSVTVYVNITIDDNGKVINSMILRKYRDDVDAEALRVANLLHFEMTPYTAHNINMPIKFTRK